MSSIPIEVFIQSVPQYAVLKLAVVNNDPELLELYTAHIAKHNAATDGAIWHNSGFDLFVPTKAEFASLYRTKMVDLQIKCEMLYYNHSYTEENDATNTDCNTYMASGYYMYPRSSISKTPLMLANHVGIIDSGYRGNLIAALRCLYTDDSASVEENAPHYTIEKHTRLFQICHPSMCPVYVVLVPESELTTTERGEGGFGSTGIIGATTTTTSVSLPVEK